MLKKAALMGILATAMALAQGRGGGMGGDDMGGMGGGRGGDMGGMGTVMPRRASRAEQFADKLKLNKEQKEETQKVLSAAFERSAAVRAEMDQRRADIAGAILDGKPADEVKKATDAYAVSCAQLAKIEADAFAKIWTSLKPNQQQKADQAFELLAGMFTAASGRGRGGPGAGRGRGAGR